MITDDQQPSKFYLGICMYIWELKDKDTEYQIRWSIA